MINQRRAGFSLIEVIAVLVVAGLMTGLAAVSLRGVTRAERLDDAVERLRLLDERVRTLAEREHRVWRIDVEEARIAARPADAGEEDEAGVLEVRLGDSLRLAAWRAGGEPGERAFRVWVDAEGASTDYGWSLRRTEEGPPVPDADAVGVRRGRFAGRTGQFSREPRPIDSSFEGSGR